MTLEQDKIFELPDSGFMCLGCFMLKGGRCYAAGLALGLVSLDDFYSRFATRNRRTFKDMPPPSCQNSYSREDVLDLAESKGLQVVEREIHRK